MSIAVQKIMSTCYMMMSPCQQGHRLGRVFNAVFTLVFNDDDDVLWESQSPELEDHGCEDDKRPFDPELMRFTAPT